MPSFGCARMSSGCGSTAHIEAHTHAAQGLAFLDHNDRDVAQRLPTLDASCRHAISERLDRAAENTASRVPAELSHDATSDGVTASVAKVGAVLWHAHISWWPRTLSVVCHLSPPRCISAARQVSISYLVMAHRQFAAATVARLFRVLWSPSHLFLLHIDKRVLHS